MFHLPPAKLNKKERELKNDCNHLKWNVFAAVALFYNIFSEIFWSIENNIKGFSSFMS